MHLDPPNGPALVGRWQRQLVLRPLRTLVRLRSAPETGSPGKRDCLTCPDPHLTRGRALDSAPTRLSATWQMVTTWSIKKQFPSSLGFTHSTSDSLHDGRILCPPFRTCGHTPPVFPHVLRQRARSDDSSPQGNPLVSSHGTNPPGKTASGLRGFSPLATRRFPSHGAPILVRGSSTAVLRAEIAVLLAKDAIETVPSAEIKKGFYSPYLIVPKKGGGLRPILDLRVLNRALLKLPFKMLTLKHMLTVRTVSAEVCGNTQMRVYGPPETGSEAPGAHGILSRGHAAGPDAHETVATLASYPSTFRVNIPPSCCKTLSPWTDIVFLRVQTHRYHRCFQDRLGRRVQRSFRMSQLAHHPLLSLRATHIPGEANRMADSLSRQAPPPIGPTDLGSIQPGTSKSLCLTGIHPLPVVVQSNRASFANGASLTDICRAAGWATPNTFAKMSARVLNASS
ncbi:hypothetical protein M9458_045334 [Cirrhinus mrigala]|uniref:Uncharacterized protein n=1 Tax=Cirrhinus mrigala TaxID=683832 RepID=A0ABD0NI10_CIRMR